MLPPALEVQRNTGPNFREIHLDSKVLTRYWWGLGLPLYLAKSNFDLFHGTNYDIPRWGKVPSVVTIHDLSLLLHSDTHNSRLVERARRRLPAVSRLAKMIITGSESVKREIVEHLNVPSDNVAVTPYAQRSSFKPASLAENLDTRKRMGIEDNFILFAGTIEPRKGLLTLVEAYADLRRHQTLTPQLVIAGPEGWLMDDFLSSISALGLDDRIKFTGYVSDQDLTALYSSCLAFIYPSIYEGFGLPPLEAMACGAPVITTDIPVLLETVGTAACLVAPANKRQLAQALMNVIADRSYRQRLSLDGLEHSKRFSWDRTARLTLDVYKEALGRR